MSITKIDHESFLKHSGYVANRAMNVAETFIRKGIDTIQLDEIIGSTILEFGGEPAFLGMYQGYKYNSFISVNETILQGVPNNYKLQSQDIVRITLAVSTSGYIVKKTRTFIVNNNDFIQRIIIQLDRIIQFITDKIHNKIYAKNVCRDVRGSITRAGYVCPSDFIGHGIGSNIVQSPFIKPDSKEKIMKNNAIFIAPIISLNKNTDIKIIRNDNIKTYMDNNNKNCVQIGETILVKKFNNDIITKKSYP